MSRTGAPGSGCHHFNVGRKKLSTKTEHKATTMVKSSMAFSRYLWLLLFSAALPAFGDKFPDIDDKYMKEALGLPELIPFDHVCGAHKATTAVRVVGASSWGFYSVELFVLEGGVIVQRRKYGTHGGRYLSTVTSRKLTIGEKEAKTLIEKLVQSLPAKPDERAAYHIIDGASNLIQVYNGKKTSVNVFYSPEVLHEFRDKQPRFTANLDAIHLFAQRYTHE